ncbi:MAG: pyridoxal phosphate-dependent aminotransferase [Bacillota bacterium]|nr:pyridoxal phosphate-dependent aminotransferase [Bacillota bacterium]
MELSRLSLNLQPSVTLEITAKAKKMREDGFDVISFGAGEPDFNTPENIISAAINAMNKGHTKYTSSSGILELKRAICTKLFRENVLKYDTSQIIVSTGAKQCLSNLFQAILNPGDEIIITAPYWISYPELIRLYGGVPVFVDTKEENNFKCSRDELMSALTSRTKAIMVNSPNNPTGTVYDYDDLKSIADFAEENELLIISDEIYEKLIYDGKKHISIASISDDAYERTVVINGMSKTYSMTGWRVGYAAGPERIIEVMSSIQSHTTSNPTSISQYAALEALKGPQDRIFYMLEQFELRRNFMVKRIDEIANITCFKPMGAFYVMINITDLIGKKINNLVIKGSESLSKILFDESRVAVIPGTAFGTDNYIRLSYATSMESIEEGLDRLEQFINNLI